MPLLIQWQIFLRPLWIFFLRWGGAISCTVTRGRRYSVDLYITLNLLCVLCTKAHMLFSYHKLLLFNIFPNYSICLLPSQEVLKNCPTLHIDLVYGANRRPFLAQVLIKHHFPRHIPWPDCGCNCLALECPLTDNGLWI